MNLVGIRQGAAQDFYVEVRLPAGFQDYGFPAFQQLAGFCHVARDVVGDDHGTVAVGVDQIARADQHAGYINVQIKIFQMHMGV